MLSVIMALISPREERRVPNIKMPWIIPLCLLCFTPVICGTSFQQFRVGTYTYFGGEGGGGGVIPYRNPTSSIFDCVRLIYIAEITLSKESGFIKGMALFAVNLDLNFD